MSTIDVCRTAISAEAIDALDVCADAFVSIILRHAAVMARTSGDVTVRVAHVKDSAGIVAAIFESRVGLDENRALLRQLLAKLLAERMPQARHEAEDAH